MYIRKEASLHPNAIEKELRALLTSRSNYNYSHCIDRWVILLLTVSIANMNHLTLLALFAAVPSALAEYDWNCYAYSGWRLRYASLRPSPTHFPYYSVIMAQ